MIIIYTEPIELVIVIAIFAVLIMITLPLFSSSLEEAVNSEDYKIEAVDFDIM